MRSQLSRVTELHEHYKRQLEKKDAETSQTKNIIQLNADYELTQMSVVKWDPENDCQEPPRASSWRFLKIIFWVSLNDWLRKEDQQMRRVRRECENRVDQYEECMVQLQSDMQKEVNKQVELL